MKGVRSVLRMEKIDLNVPPSLLTFAHATTIGKYLKEPLDPIIYELPSRVQTPPFFLERDLENDLWVIFFWSNFRGTFIDMKIIHQERVAISKEGGKQSQRRPKLTNEHS